MRGIKPNTFMHQSWQAEDSRGVSQEHRDYGLFSGKLHFITPLLPSGMEWSLEAERLPGQEGQQQSTAATYAQGCAQPPQVGTSPPAELGPAAKPRHQMHVSYSNTTTKCKQQDCHCSMGQQFYPLSDKLSIFQFLEMQGSFFNLIFFFFW